MNTPSVQACRWFHEPWPWLLMAGPALVVLAGVVTTYLAVVTSDGMVADDYYKRGLAINQTLARDEAARQLGLRAQIAFQPDAGSVTVKLEGAAPAYGPLVLRLAHPGRPALDKLLRLTSAGNGTHTSAYPPLTTGRWQVTLEDTKQHWRLTSDVTVPGQKIVVFTPRE